jgi:hypothetical protein
MMKTRIYFLARSACQLMLLFLLLFIYVEILWHAYGYACIEVFDYNVRDVSSPY